MCFSDNFLKALLKLKNDIKYSGWLILPSNNDSNKLLIRVEWYFKDIERYAYQESLDVKDLDSLDLFIHKANEAIDDYLKFEL